MARYWYGRFLETNDPLDLGPVLHAIGDASIPHHAAGYLGNWHQAYEADIAEYVVNVINSESDRDKIMNLLMSWNRIDGKHLIDDESAKDMIIFVTAMKVLVLKKALSGQ